MAVRLLKGQEIAITRNYPGLRRLNVSLGWNLSCCGKEHYDLDSSVFLCDAKGRALSSRHFVFYNNPADPGGAVAHLGDNRTGAGKNEEILIDLEKLEPGVVRMVFAVTIHNGEDRKQSFGQVDNSYLRILDESSGEEIVRFDLKNDFSSETGIIIGEICREGQEWKFRADGQGFSGGLRNIVMHHGLL